MTEAAVVNTDLRDADAGRALGREVLQSLGGASPDALILFASPQHDFEALLAALDESCRPGVLVGCSSAGEFTSRGAGEGLACAVALRSADIQFAAAIGRDVSGSRVHAAEQVVDRFRGMLTHESRFRTALVLTDALAGFADDLVEQLTLRTAGTYTFFGGGAGDDARFRRTHVFFGREVVTNAVVALEMLSSKPIGLGVQHGWEPSGPGLRVTESQGMRLVGLNAAPAVEAFEDHAERTGQRFDRSDPLPFFLHNIIGLQTSNGHKLRVPLAVDPDGSITCAAEIPEGATVHIMSATTESAIHAAARAADMAVGQLGGHRPAVALFFDCVATRLRMGREFGLELDSLQESLGPVAFAGCNTYGQIARGEGQFSGFHNCTAVVCAIPA